MVSVATGSPRLAGWMMSIQAKKLSAFFRIPVHAQYSNRVTPRLIDCHSKATTTATTATIATIEQRKSESNLILYCRIHILRRPHSVAWVRQSIENADNRACQLQMPSTTITITIGKLLVGAFVVVRFTLPVLGAPSKNGCLPFRAPSTIAFC